MDKLHFRYCQDIVTSQEKTTRTYNYVIVTTVQWTISINKKRLQDLSKYKNFTKIKYIRVRLAMSNKTRIDDKKIP